jgi:hypothetical protein
MPSYTCVLIGRSDEVVKLDTVEATDAAMAMSRAKQIYWSQQDISAIEIWQMGRLALRVTRHEMSSICARRHQAEAPPPSAERRGNSAGSQTG